MSAGAGAVVVGVPVSSEVPIVVGVDIDDETDDGYIELQMELREKNELIMTLQRNMADQIDRHMDLLEITEKKDKRILEKDKLILDLQNQIIEMQISMLKE